MSAAHLQGLGFDAVAAGTGKLSRMLAERFPRVAAVEPSEGMRALLQREAPAAEALAGSAIDHVFT